MKCPKCGKENDDNWPITVGSEILPHGCQDCWEEESDIAWWKMFDKIITRGGV